MAISQFWPAKEYDLYPLFSYRGITLRRLVLTLKRWPGLPVLISYLLRNEVIYIANLNWSANLTFCVTFHNFLCPMLTCLLCCSRLMSGFVLFCFFVFVFCRSGCRHNYHVPLPLLPLRPPLWLCAYPQLSL